MAAVAKTISIRTIGVDHRVGSISLLDRPKIIKMECIPKVVESSYMLDCSSDESSSGSSTPARKRQRLDHLSVEEKMMRRKLKNRVAAQTARDRKKARMTYLEDQMKLIISENKKLRHKNEQLQKVNKELTAENIQLNQRLGIPIVKQEKVEEKVGVVKEAKTEKSLGHASSINVPLLKAQESQILATLMMHYIFLPMMLSVMTFYECSNNSVKNFQKMGKYLQFFKNQQNLKKDVNQQIAPHIQWWGPPQRNWNPSENS